MRATAGNTELVGLSEGGFRGLFQPLVVEAGTVAVSEHNLAAASASPEEDAATAALFNVGAVLDVTVELQQEQVRAKAEVIRRHEREDGRRELSVRFIGLPEYMQDVIRARVFAGLRELRLRGLL